MALQSAAGRAGGSGATAASTIAEALAHLVLHEMQPGMNLPSEAELAARFGVNRLTVREAVKMLAGRGLLRSPTT
jgi:DNA-binding FadR family transcriptional regulator